MLKDFVVKYGRILFDVGAWILVILILTSGSLMLSTKETFVIGILILIVGTLLFLLLYFFAYVFLDIRDKLEELVELKKQDKE